MRIDEWWARWDGGDEKLRVKNECDAAEEARAMNLGKTVSLCYVSEKKSQVRVEADGTISFAQLTADILKRMNREAKDD